MPDFTVVWEIDLDADDHADAAHQALTIQRDPQSSATVFTVHGTDSTTLVDLDRAHRGPSGTATPVPVPTA